MSKKTLPEVLDLLEDVFDLDPEDYDYPPRWMGASLEPEKHKKLLKDFGNRFNKVYGGCVLDL